MEKNFIFIEEMSIFKKIFFSVFLALGIVLLLSGGIFYGFIILGIATKFLMQEGVELDLHNLKYRELVTWYGIKFGKWKKLPDIEYVSVFETKKTSRFRAGGGNATYASELIFKLNLFYQRNKHITLLATENKDKAMEIGNNISNILGVQLNNATK
ncbi:hypothetical protein FF125_04665 [Aureibaculum algae]|uniref:Uncharacterized protein n=1 Tax=Aureibaculum algae TaxID=2584122 RepID=A0A5B7TNG8_9FLAO|nr:hypothetical protein [Aureibaculum algae]QCX37760.1 hypothetical protein FF125_04665 [Aureibaculum algae]